ncbi:MAG: hypothetical protein JJU11_10130 [Candidatus Sumerlaeia bacterium]|nr:hypothetical protein [Candidatus Sumerlaeia bacterium]
MTKNSLTILLALAFSGAVAVAAATPVHVSEFDSPAGTNPNDTNDVSRAWAVDGTFTGGVFGHYAYTGDGMLKLSHPPNHDWDDPYYEIDLNEFTSITTGTMELQIDLVPDFDPDAAFQYIEILVTGSNLGNNGNDSRAQADLTLRLRSQLGALSVGYNRDTAGIPYQTLSTTAAELDSVQFIVNYDEPSQEWQGFFRINDDVLKEFNNSPVTRERTQNTLRVGCQVWWEGVKGPFDLYSEEVRIYDSIQTTEGEYEVGEVLRHSQFNQAADSGNFFLPINSGDVNSLFVPAPATHDYDGEGTWWVNHPGTQDTNPNANITKVTSSDKSAEWVMHIKPDWTAAGNGQMYNFKVDGNDAAFFVGNFTGGSTETWLIIFGEDTDIFNPDPSNVAAQTVPAEDVTDVVLIINYDADNEEFNGYYSVNGGAIQAHPGNPVARARSGQANNENQWQAWRTDAGEFSVGLHDYKELFGVVTTVETRVQDFMMFE